MDAQEVLNIIQESIGRKRKTFGHGFKSAYHTIKLGDEMFEGWSIISVYIYLELLFSSLTLAFFINTGGGLN